MLLPKVIITGHAPPQSYYHTLTNAPPSYHEAVHGKEELVQEEEGVIVQGGGAWAPSYPTYKFNAVM